MLFEVQVVDADGSVHWKVTEKKGRAVRDMATGLCHDVASAMQNISLAFRMWVGEPEPKKITRFRAKIRNGRRLAVTNGPDLKKRAPNGSGHYTRPGSVKNLLLVPGVMTGEGQTVEQITMALERGNARAFDRLAVAKILAANKGLFERVRFGVYRLAGAPVAIAAPVVTEKKEAVAQETAETNELQVLAEYPPYALTDGALKRRLELAAKLGRSDQVARLEFIKRRAQA